MKGECKLVNEQYHCNTGTNIDDNTVATTTHMLVLPYKGEKGEKVIKSSKKHAKKVLPDNHVSRHAYRIKKLGSFFNIKDQIKLEHSNDFLIMIEWKEKDQRPY